MYIYRVQYSVNLFSLNIFDTGHALFCVIMYYILFCEFEDGINKAKAGCFLVFEQQLSINYL